MRFDNGNLPNFHGPGNPDIYIPETRPFIDLGRPYGENFEYRGIKYLDDPIKPICPFQSGPSYQPPIFGMEPNPSDRLTPPFMSGPSYQPPIFGMEPPQLGMPTPFGPQFFQY
ncbi:MAG: hypothetical protein ACP5OG_05415 [Candidatus Nanoarchaeia archaeon]